jgi:hypothetical protein
MGEKGNTYMLLAGKPEGTRPLKTPRHWWVDSIKTGLREIGSEVLTGLVPHFIKKISS